MKKKIIFLILITLIFSGCSYRELNELAIANAVGIDYIDNKYVVTTQVLKLSKEGENSTSNNSILYEGHGDSIVDAIRDISMKYPNNLYLGHLELMIIGNGMIDKGINDCFDYFLRSPEARNDVYLLVSKDNSAKEILNPDSEKEEDFPTRDIITTINNSMKKNGHATDINLEEFIANYLDKGIDPIASTIILEKNEENEYKDTILGNIAVFKNNNLIGLLSDNSSFAYNLINNKIDNAIVHTKYKGNPISVTVGLNKSNNIKLDIKNNKINVDINIKTDGYILEINAKEDIADQNALRNIGYAVNKEIEKYIDELIKFNIDNDTDILGLKNKIYKYYYDDYDKYKDKNIYEIANINKNVNVEVYRYGSIYRSALGG